MACEDSEQPGGAGWIPALSELERPDENEPAALFDAAAWRVRRASGLGRLDVAQFHLAVPQDQRQRQHSSGIGMRRRKAAEHHVSPLPIFRLVRSLGGKQQELRRDRNLTERHRRHRRAARKRIKPT